MFMRRRVVATIAFVVHTAIMFAVGTTAILVIVDPVHGWMEALDLLRSPHELLFEHEWWLLVGYPILLLVLTQAAFLVPYFHRRPLAGRRSKSLTINVIALAIVPASLTIGLIAAVGGLVDLIRGDVHPWEVHPDGVGRWLRFMALIVLPISWILWTVVLLLFTRRASAKTPGTSRRILGLIVGGTIVEFVLILPLDAMVRRQTDCYCDTRAYFAMCFSIWALLWLTGPGIVLLLTRRYRARLWSKSHCWNCGFGKGPSPGQRCPECGYAWIVDDS